MPKLNLTHRPRRMRRTESLRALAVRAGFRPGPVWTDEKKLFSVHWLHAPT